MNWVNNEVSKASQKQSVKTNKNEIKKKKVT